MEALHTARTLRTAVDRIDPDFRSAYAWMARKLAEKVPPPDDVIHPVWAWYRASGLRKHRPDLRQRWGETGQETALVEFTLPEEAVLLSDYDTWHFPLNGWFLGRTEAEQAAFDREEPHLDPLARKARVEASWDAVLDGCALDEDFHGARDERRIQAVAWEIPGHRIRSVRRFRSR